MKNTSKLILGLGAAIIIAAAVLTYSLISGGGLKPEETTAPLYTLQPTTQPSTTQPNTESWVDLNQMASDLATATDTSNESDVSTTQSVSGNTVISYVYINGQDPNGPTVNPSVQDIETLAPVSTTNPSNVEATSFKYTLNTSTNTVTVTKYLGSEKLVHIPQYIAGYKVTAIGDGCFKDNAKITGVYIDENITTIGNAAFMNCKNLAMVDFTGVPYTITVGENAFKKCESLVTIDLPAAESIGRFAFDGCVALKKIEIKAGTKRIEDYCFANCTGLTELIIPQSVIYLPVNAISNHSAGLVIKGYTGSLAEELANAFPSRITFLPLDGTAY
jgi:hypothetical protein